MRYAKPALTTRSNSGLILTSLACILFTDMVLSSPFLMHPRLTLFAAGGFGGSSKVKGKGGKKKKQKQKHEKQHPVIKIGAPKHNSFSTPEARMAHVSSRISAADFTPMTPLASTAVLGNSDGQVGLDVDPNAICVVDNFLGSDFIISLRSEAEGLLPSMVPSQSTRWDEASQSVVAYEKHQVMSTQIVGGTEGYAASPHLVEYVVTLTQSLSAKLNQILPDNCKLSGTEQTNKLAVCLGEGSKYDKHIDNGGGSDQRKLTALLYLQPSAWQHEGKYPNESETDDERGGYFRAHDVPDKGEIRSIAPKGDRLLLFWSDSLVHDVSPSYAPNGEDDRRWALTVWFVVNKGGVIRTTSTETEDRHFGTVSG